MAELLRRYWFEFEARDGCRPSLAPSGGFDDAQVAAEFARRRWASRLAAGCGVTAVDEADAHAIVAELGGEFLPPVRAVLVDVDVSAL